MSLANSGSRRSRKKGEKVQPAKQSSCSHLQGGEKPRVRTVEEMMKSGGGGDKGQRRRQLEQQEQEGQQGCLAHHRI